MNDPKSTPMGFMNEKQVQMTQTVDNSEQEEKYNNNIYTQNELEPTFKI